MAIAPLATLVCLHGTEKMFQFISELCSPRSFHYFRRFYRSFRHLADPVWPSIVSYLLGLGFYVTHIPERFVVDRRMAHLLDSIGVGSHAIWHVFIVVGMSQYRTAIEGMRNGIGCETP